MPTSPEFSSEDIAYITSEYLTLEQLCNDRAQTPDDVRAQAESGKLPGAAYKLPDGTQMFPPDYFVLLDTAGDVGGLRASFDQRHRAATSALGLVDVDPDEDWRGYLSGDYGVCLREVTPEAMVEKTALIAQIETLTAVPATEDEGWRTSLREAVDDLDGLERPFTDYDRQRWGGTTRDSHITAIRARYLGVGPEAAQ